jgi:hypothetical protein
MTTRIEDRISDVLAEASTPPGDEADALLSEGYTRALKLDAERLTLERKITALAARADDPDAAQELRRAWLRHRTLNAELRELRILLRRLKDEAAL